MLAYIGGKSFLVLKGAERRARQCEELAV